MTLHISFVKYFLLKVIGIYHDKFTSLLFIAGALFLAILSLVSLIILMILKVNSVAFIGFAIVLKTFLMLKAHDL
jgi:hypothetical protein